MNLESLLALERNAARLATILGVLAKYGLADWLSGLDYAWLRDKFKSADGQQLTELNTDGRIRLALTELGPIFIKLGQILSTRPDIVGPSLADELSKLQSKTKPAPAELVRKVVEDEFGQPPKTLFREFDDTGFASASIAQVHHAVLPDGNPVVVKVQHAGLEEQAKRDLDILEGLAELAQKHSPALRLYQPVAVARQFRRTLLRELDFNHERRNIEQFTANFESDPTVRFPKVFPEFCTQRVLTMERLHGIQGTNVDALKRSGQDLNEFTRRGANIYLNMIFRDGFYHADPHPGNLLMLEENVVGMIDCGMVAYLNDNLREEIEGMLLAATNGNAEELSEIVLRIGSTPLDCKRDELVTDIAEFLQDHVNQSLEHFDVSAALTGLIKIISRYHIQLPAPLSMLLKVLIMLEGTSRNLDRNFSLAELIKPFYLQSARRRFAPAKLWRQFHKAFREWERLFDSLPNDLANIISRVRSGTFHVRLEHRRIESTVNRLIIGILTAALFLGSTLLWSTQAPPLLGGISVFGAIGYALSFWLGLRLLLAIRKSGNIQSKDNER